MKASKINLRDFSSVPMRTFWITSFAFFICFFSWFGIVPFMPDVVEALGLSSEQKYNCIIIAVAGTIIARLLLGNLCDKFGPRYCYTVLLSLASIPLFALYFVESYVGFMFCRFFTGFIGAAFVITQYHTSQMFASNCVGMANATSAGWGNLGGGANRLGMPLLGALIISMGVSQAMAWRWAMVIMGFLSLLVALLYFWGTQDTPEGNFKQLRAKGQTIPQRKDTGRFIDALKDYRVVLLFFVYAGCFGLELTVYACLDDYLQNKFGLERVVAGYIVLSFALMNIFARSLGGFFGDLFGKKQGLSGRVLFLVIIMVLEGLSLCLFSQMDIFWLAILVLVFFSICVQMAEGATFTVVPFVNKKCLGSVMGIVGAGGNFGAVCIGLFLKWNITPAIDKAHIYARENQFSLQQTIDSVNFAEASAMGQAFFWISIGVVLLGLLCRVIVFSPKEEEEEQREVEKVIMKLNKQGA